MSVKYVELVDDLAIAAEVTGVDPVTLARVTKVNLADSPLHAPAAATTQTVGLCSGRTRPGACSRWS